MTFAKVAEVENTNLVFDLNNNHVYLKGNEFPPDIPTDLNAEQNAGNNDDDDDVNHLDIPHIHDPVPTSSGRIA